MTVAVRPRRIRPRPRENRRDWTPAQFRLTLRRLGLSQMEAARRLYVDPRSVRRWASGETPVPGPAIAALDAMYALKRLGAWWQGSERIESLTGDL